MARSWKDHCKTFLKRMEIQRKTQEQRSFDQRVLQAQKAATSLNVQKLP